MPKLKENDEIHYDMTFWNFYTFVYKHNYILECIKGQALVTFWILFFNFKDDHSNVTSSSLSKYIVKKCF
jgi:hypothetical protein